MKIVDFAASPDLVGRRIRVGWEFELEGVDSLADIPRVRVRRKLRDFDYPADARFVLYDSGAFPPAGTVAADLPTVERRAADGRTVIDVETVARAVAGQPVEVLRRTTTTRFGLDGLPTRRRIELLDTGDLLGGLQPGLVYYYELDLPAHPGVPTQRGTALAGEGYGLGRTLYESLPAIYRRHDVVQRPPTTGAEWVPEAAVRSGQLRRFLDLFGTALDLLRSTAEGLRGLHDLDHVDYRYLPLLARWIGADLSFDVGIPTQRNELKHAPRLFRGVGTAPVLRTIHTRTAGWSAQVAEFAQSIARANLPPELNIFAQREEPDGWHGIDDAAALLGFGPGNNSVNGAPNVRASLSSSRPEPYALRPGLELLIAADGGQPEILRFGPADFGAIDRATAAELAAVVNRDLAAVTAEVINSRLTLRSDISGPASALRVLTPPASLVSLEAAPSGRLSAFVDNGDRIRLFYATQEPLGAGARIRYKSLIGGTWTDSLPLDVAGEVPHGEPAAVELPNGDVLLAWVEQPHTAAARLRFTRGTVQPLLPARLAGQRRGPFAGLVGARLVLRGNWPGTETITFVAGDFANTAQATVAEVAAAITNRSTRVDAAELPNGTLGLSSVAAGPEALLIVDGRQSSAAVTLGFGASLVTARGAWSDAISWQPSGEIVQAPGRYADLHALRAADNSVWLFWAQHTGGAWTIRSSRWNGTTWSAPEQRAGGGAREPCAALDPTNRIWLIWSQLSPSGDAATLRASIFTPGTTTWSAPEEIATPPSRAADREPSLVLTARGIFRLFFSSDREGGRDLWMLFIDSSQASPNNWVIGGPDPLGATPAIDRHPAALLVDSTIWLLLRSDRSVDLARAAPVRPGTPGGPAAASGTLRRYAGTTSAVLADQPRNDARRQWDDLGAYTPSRPLGSAREGALLDNEWYTRGTVGFYIAGVDPADPATQQQVVRLRQLLPRFLPINARAVIILPPP